MFILSLAVSDLIVGGIVMPISSTYILTHDWIFGRNFCQFWITTDYTASTASILNILILSLDRYWSIKSPLQYLRKRTKKRALAMICIVWLISSSWALPILFWHTWYNENGQRKHPENVCETEFSDNIIFKLTSSFVNFILPIIMMMVLYAKIFLEIKRRGKLNIGRYSSHIHRPLTKNSDQSTIKPNNETGLANIQTSVKHPKSTRLKEHLSEKLSLRDSKLRKENGIKEVSFSKENLNNKCNATLNSLNGKQKKMHLAAFDSSNNKNVISRVDLRNECDSKDQVANCLETKEKVEELKLNGSDCVNNNEEKSSEDDSHRKNENEKIKKNETMITRQKYQQLTILNAGNIENKLKELDTLKAEVQIVTSQDVDKNEASKKENNKILDKDLVLDENLNFNKSYVEEDSFESNIHDNVRAQQARRVNFKKLFLLPKVTIYLQKNLHLDRKSRKRKLKRQKKQTEFDCSMHDDESFDKENRVTAEDANKTEIQSIDTLTDSFNQKAKKRFRSLLWLSKMTSPADQQTISTQSNSLETPAIAFKKRIEFEETGSLSFDFSSSVPRSLEDLPTSSSMQPTSIAPAARPILIQSRLLPFSCSSSSLRINRSNLRNNQQQSQTTNTDIFNDTSPTKASPINRTLNRNTLTKSTINLHTSTMAGSRISSGPVNAYCLSLNRSIHSYQPNHSSSLHLASASPTSVNQNSALTTSSNQDYLTTQSNQSSFCLSRIESSRLKQEKKAALQLGLIMGGFLVCWIPYIIVYIVTAQCQCIDNTIHTVAIWLAYLNSTLNPVLYFMGPNSSRFKAAFRKLLLRKSVPKHLIDHSIHPNGKIPINPQLMTAPGLTFHTTLTTNNKRTSSVHTRLSRTTSNKSEEFKKTTDNKFKANKTLNYSLREVHNK